MNEKSYTIEYLKGFSSRFMFYNSEVLSCLFADALEWLAQIKKKKNVSFRRTSVVASGNRHSTEDVVN
jgi:hypothetical protein